MPQISKFIKTFNIYGNFFNLRINRSAKFKSVIGGFLSFITMGVLTFCVMIFGKDFFEKLHPKVAVEDGLFEDIAIPLLKGSFPMIEFLSTQYLVRLT
jgi:hypothetical protein